MSLSHDPTASHDDIAAEATSAVVMPAADAEAADVPVEVDADVAADAIADAIAEVPPVVPPIPDRADAPVSEIAERFLKMVLTHVPLERIEELHLFSPLRQGGVETGIAVIAARVPVLVIATPAAPELPFDVAPAEREIVVEALVVAAESVEEAFEEALEDVEPAAAEDVVEAVAEVEAEDVAEAEAEDVVEAAEIVVAPPVPRVRHTVYTARYRLVQKGPERGKWEANVVAEADAPLVTVDLVVRGVQRRAGEESEIVRYSAPQLARALRIAPPIAPPTAPPEG